ncbi:MAG: hypothetical protein Q4C90_04095 [Kocuria sp.]|uniref:hypothetical protein n=1 Tax=Kocuria sp. TaxID=1871328 RepID=UPI0026DABA28|nr:hypothetical protein [Kocuria sp.]MDO4256343.1 hypothetical protein [Kocuria sp.]
MSELVYVLVKYVSEQGQLDAISVLAHEISNEVGAEFERYLGAGGPGNDRGNRHLWCVLLATICRLYDQLADFVAEGTAALVDRVFDLLEREVSEERGEETQVRDIYQYKHRVAAAFGFNEFTFLRPVVQKAVSAVIAAMNAVGEETVMRHLRLIGAVVCPDPDRHPDVVRYCIWPLLQGPFRELLEASVEDEMRTWLRNAFPVVPRGA